MGKWPAISKFIGRELSSGALFFFPFFEISARNLKPEKSHF
jgi:hypothetical protein